MKKIVIGIAVAAAFAMFTLTLIAAVVSYQAVVSPKAAIVNVDGKVQASAVTSTELGYLSGVTSALQTQLGTKATYTGLIQAGSVVASANGKVTNTFSPAFSVVPTVVVGSTATNEGAHLISVTISACVLGTLTPGSNINFIAIGTP
jgi:hypothetical protein